MKQLEVEDSYTFRPFYCIHLIEITNLRESVGLHSSMTPSLSNQIHATWSCIWTQVVQKFSVQKIQRAWADTSQLIALSCNCNSSVFYCVSRLPGLIHHTCMSCQSLCKQDPNQKLSTNRKFCVQPPELPYSSVRHWALNSNTKNHFRYEFESRTGCTSEYLFPSV